jgi:proline racemase
MFWQRTITVVDAHAEGETGRVVVGGVLPPPGATMFEKMRHMASRDDRLRRFLLNEPRVGATSSANLVVPPTRADADVGFIIMEASEYPPMSGSNTICTATVLLETGMVAMTEPETRFTLEAPGGLIPIVARCRNGRCEQITFTNVPCFVLHLDHAIEVTGLGTISVDVAYGGMIFAFADARALGFRLTADEARDITDAGSRITAAAAEQIEAVHPENAEIRDVSITSIAGPVEDADGDRLQSRNACVVQPGRIDRCPTGTATSARLSILHARGRIRQGQIFENRSIIDTRFESEIVAVTEVGGIPAVVPAVSGRGFVVGIYQYGYDPNDPFPEGFRLGRAPAP